MKKIRSIILFVSSLLMTVPHLLAVNTYYVSPTGNDSNSGLSTSLPWRTISKVSAHVFTPGEGVLFQGGQTFVGNLVFGMEDTGTPASHVRVSSYGSGRASINPSSGIGINIQYAQGYEIRNLNIVGSGYDIPYPDSTDISGIRVEILQSGPAIYEDYVIDNVTVSNFPWAGIEFRFGMIASFKDITITNVEAYSNGAGGILINGQCDPNGECTWSGVEERGTSYNVNISHCYVHDNVGIEGGAGSGHGWISNAGILVIGVDGGTVERCVAKNNGLRPWAQGLCGAIQLGYSKNVVVQYCETDSNKTGSGYDGEGFALDNTINCTMQYNYSLGNDGPGYFLGAEYGGESNGNTIRYNISENDGRNSGTPGSGIFVWRSYDHPGSMTGIENIYNNSIYITPSYSAWGGIVIMDGVEIIHLRNNLIHTTGGVPVVYVSSPYSNPGLRFEGNAYYANGGAIQFNWGGSIYTGLAAFQWSTGGQEMLYGNSVGYEGNPQLTAPGGGGTIEFANIDQMESLLTAYHLGSSAPIINAGLDLWYNFGIDAGTRDFYGNSLPQGGAFDIGAHEPNVSSLGAPALISPINDVPVNGWKATLKWTVPTGGDAATWYYVYMVAPDGVTAYDYWLQGTQVSTGTLTQRGLHTWAVTAFNETSPDVWVQGEGSIEARFDLLGTLTAPSGLTATQASGRVTCRWTDRSPNESGFEIDRATGATSTSFTRVGQVAANVTTFSQNVTRGQTYRYKVRAIRNPGTPSAFTPIVNIVVP